MTKVYFVRHAQPDYADASDHNRVLTKEGLEDRKIVFEILKDKQIDVAWCSPYVRSLETIRPLCEHLELDVHTDERLRERDHGKKGNTGELIKARWNDHDLHEEGGESLNECQKRNIEVLNEILEAYEGHDIVIGTHGTALATILSYYDPSFGYEDFMRFIDWMPYIVALEFEEKKLLHKQELGHIYKPFKADPTAW